MSIDLAALDRALRALSASVDGLRAVLCAGERAEDPKASAASGDLIRAADLARTLGVTKETARRIARKHGEKVGGRWYVPRDRLKSVR